MKHPFRFKTIRAIVITLICLSPLLSGCTAAAPNTEPWFQEAPFYVWNTDTDSWNLIDTNGDSSEFYGCQIVGDGAILGFDEELNDYVPVYTGLPGDGTPYPLCFAIELFDSNNLFDAETSPTNLYIKDDGYYLVMSTIMFGLESVAGNRYMNITGWSPSAGALDLAYSSSIGFDPLGTRLSCFTVVYLDTDSFLNVNLWQDSGEILTVPYKGNIPNLTVIKLD